MEAHSLVYKMVTKDTLMSGGSLGAVMGLVLALVLTGGFSADATNVFFGTNGVDITCKPMTCDKLSSPNKLGISSRCYFFSEDLNRTTYKSCKDGWIPFEKPDQDVKNVTFGDESIFLVCEKENKLINNCQVLERNETITKVELN